MNIFKTNPCLIKSAQELPNKLVVKMPTETAQILATGFPLSRLADDDCPRTKTGEIRGHFNPKHPSCLWARETSSNFLELLYHGLSLSEEYSTRYKKTHDSLRFLEWVDKNIKQSNVPHGALTKLKLAMPVKYQIFNEDYKCYQYFMNSEKSYSLWPSVTKIPDWWHEISEKYVDKSFVGGQYTKR